VDLSNGAVEGAALFGVTGRLLAVPGQRVATVVVVAYNGRDLCDSLASVQQRQRAELADGRHAGLIVLRGRNIEVVCGRGRS
jgi:hypothetical protein